MAASAIRSLQRLNDEELRTGAAGTSKSWHEAHRDSAYICVGGLDFGLTEGDVLCVLSQFGEPVDILMPRDRKTGKRRGFAFVAFEDQRSTDMAVDNLNGVIVAGRAWRVDHVADFKVPEDDHRQRAVALAAEMDNDPNDAQKPKLLEDLVNDGSSKKLLPVRTTELAAKQRHGDAAEEQKFVYRPLVGDSDSDGDDTSDPASSSADTRSDDDGEKKRVHGEDISRDPRDRRHRHHRRQHHHKRHRYENGRDSASPSPGHSRDSDDDRRRRRKEKRHHHTGRSKREKKERHRSSRKDGSSALRQHGSGSDEELSADAITAELLRAEADSGSRGSTPAATHDIDGGVLCSNCLRSGHPLWDCPIPHAPRTSAGSSTAAVDDTNVRPYTGPSWQQIRATRR